MSSIFTYKTSRSIYTCTPCTDGIEVKKTGKEEKTGFISYKVLNKQVPSFEPFCVQNREIKPYFKSNGEVSFHPIKIKRLMNDLNNRAGKAVHFNGTENDKIVERKLEISNQYFKQGQKQKAVKALEQALKFTTDRACYFGYLHALYDTNGFGPKLNKATYRFIYDHFTENGVQDNDYSERAVGFLSTNEKRETVQRTICWLKVKLNPACGHYFLKLANNDAMRIKGAIRYAALCPDYSYIYLSQLQGEKFAACIKELLPKAPNATNDKILIEQLISLSNYLEHKHFTINYIKIQLTSLINYIQSKFPNEQIIKEQLIDLCNYIQNQLPNEQIIKEQLINLNNYIQNQLPNGQITEEQLIDLCNYTQNQLINAQTIEEQLIDLNNYIQNQLPNKLITKEQSIDLSNCIQNQLLNGQITEEELIDLNNYIQNQFPNRLITKEQLIDLSKCIQNQLLNGQITEEQLIYLNNYIQNQFPNEQIIKEKLISLSDHISNNINNKPILKEIRILNGLINYIQNQKYSIVKISLQQWEVLTNEKLDFSNALEALTTRKPYSCKHLIITSLQCSSEDDLTQLAKVLQDKHCHLAKITITGKDMQLKEAQAIGKLMQVKDSPLQELQLNFSPIDAECYNELQQAYQNSTLKSINIPLIKQKT